mgnify:CR=1 FL=1
MPNNIVAVRECFGSYDKRASILLVEGVVVGVKYSSSDGVSTARRTNGLSGCGSFRAGE